MLLMVVYSRPPSGHFMCQITRTYHVLTTHVVIPFAMGRIECHHSLCARGTPPISGSSGLLPAFLSASYPFPDNQVALFAGRLPRENSCS